MRLRRDIGLDKSRDRLRHCSDIGLDRSRDRLRHCPDICLTDPETDETPPRHRPRQIQKQMRLRRDIGLDRFRDR